MTFWLSYICIILAYNDISSLHCQSRHRRSGRSSHGWTTFSAAHITDLPQGRTTLTAKHMTGRIIVLFLQKFLFLSHWSNIILFLFTHTICYCFIYSCTCHVTHARCVNNLGFTLFKTLRFENILTPSWFLHKKTWELDVLKSHMNCLFIKIHAWCLSGYKHWKRLSSYFVLMLKANLTGLTSNNTQKENLWINILKTMPFWMP